MSNDLSFLARVNWRDLLDIGIISLLVYQCIQFFRGSRAMAVVSGLALLTVLYFFSEEAGLYALHWILQHVFNFIIIVIVIIFQQDIRSALGEIGSQSFFRKKLGSSLVEDIVSACKDMAKKRIGALIIIERSIPLNDLIKQEGVRIDALPTEKLIKNLFYPKAPLHDGAVIISKGRVSAAACILPLAVAKGENFGTRHRAALGISEQCDADAIVVSEERGEISLARKGVLQKNISPEELQQILQK